MTRAVLLDLGNVVLGINFRRVFRSWASSAGVDESRFYDRWQMDDAYRAHEVGQMDFAEYTRHLGTLFEVQMTIEQWRAGWNDLWTEPFAEVMSLLPEISDRYALFAFTNTNDTHAAEWRRRFGHELTDFHHIFVSSEIGRRKPDPESYAWVCAQMQVPAEDVVFLDDTLENITGAAAAGLRALHTPGEQATADALQNLLTAPGEALSNET